MKIFRQLRWKLTLSYTIVTVSAFLVILLITTGMLFGRLFLPENYLSPERLIDEYRDSNGYLLFNHILSQSPVDTELLKLWFKDPTVMTSGSELFRMGALQFWASTNAAIRLVILGADGTVLVTHRAGSLEYEIGHQIDAGPIPGLEAPLTAALAGEKDSSRLYSVIVPNQRYVLAIPIFDRLGGNEDQLLGVVVVFFDSYPTRADVPSHILQLAGRSLLIFILGVGIMGAIFGLIFAHGLTSRFQKISATADQWSEGDFSRYIDDKTGDEISQFTQRLNNMAKQLQSLLLRRQEMAVSEERNRLARDLHDSAKQQALAASLELGAALTMYDRDPKGAKEHLVEADTLVDSVRKELTNLVDELRPRPVGEQDFSETLTEYAMEWSHRSEIELNINIDGEGELFSETNDALYRIAQEALANIARHSHASSVDLSLEYGTNAVTMTVKDNGRGFDPQAQQAGVGLVSMKERAEDLGGSFTVETAPGQGTQIKVTLPVGN